MSSKELKKTPCGRNPTGQKTHNECFKTGMGVGIRIKLKPKKPVKKPKAKPKKLKNPKKPKKPKIQLNSIDDMYDLIDKQGIKEKPIKFKGTRLVSTLMLLHILKRHKNDCFILKEGLNLVDDDYGITIARSFEKIDEKESTGTSTEILKLFKMCKKVKNFVLIPLHLHGHRNILIYNPFNDNVEHIEPHGSTYGGSQKNYSLEKITKALKDFFESKKAKKILKVKVISSDKTCPWGKGVQSYIYLDKKKGKKYNNGVYIADPGGFCVAWSYFIADFRLYHPKLSIAESRLKAIKLLKEDKMGKFSNFIREYSRLFLVEIHAIYEIGKDYFIIEDELKKALDIWLNALDTHKKQQEIKKAEKKYKKLKKRKMIAEAKINFYLTNEFKKFTHIMEIKQPSWK